MSIHSNNFYSNTLRQATRVTVILPEPIGPAGTVLPDYVRGDRKLPTLWLLHGLGGDATSWLRRTNIELLATQYRIAVVMPETGRGFYTDMAAGPQYWTYLTTELPARMRYMFPLSAAPVQNYVMGNSMGGYAALRWALTMPEKFAAVAALSPVADLARFRTEQRDLMPDFDLAFTPDQLTDPATNLAALVDQLPAQTNLRVLMASGTNDRLRSMDEALRPHLAAKLPTQFDWQLTAGRHDWNLWNQQLPASLHWLLKGGWRNV